MVRLKALIKIIYTVESTFQFQYGAIEGQRKSSSLLSLKLFQFQYGAIEGRNIWVYLPDLFLFQFQYGAIEG